MSCSWVLGQDLLGMVETVRKDSLKEAFTRLEFLVSNLCPFPDFPFHGESVLLSRYRR